MMHGCVWGSSSSRMILMMSGYDVSELRSIHDSPSKVRVRRGVSNLFGLAFCCIARQGTSYGLSAAEDLTKDES